jgi:hypothetical protein
MHFAFTLLTICRQCVILMLENKRKGGEKMKALEAYAEKVGIKVSPAPRRGEVVLSFPPCVLFDAFTLRLSKKKAFFLVGWMFYSLKKSNEEV